MHIFKYLKVAYLCADIYNITFRNGSDDICYVTEYLYIYQFYTVRYGAILRCKEFDKSI